MADIANLVLAVDSTSVPKATASLDGLTAAGARAEAASLGVGKGIKSAGVEASAMAVAAQASARAAMDQAAGFSAASKAATINTLAMRETLVVARELARGNFTRIPGSLTLLSQGVASQGGLSAYASALLNSLGIIKQVQNAELAEQAAAAASAAAAVQNAAQRAAANVIAADTEIALAEAQVRVTAGTSAESAAQVRLAQAHQAVAEAAAEAAVAEDALAVAQERALEAAGASAAATTTVLGTTGAVLIGVGVAATGAVLGFKALQDQVRDTGFLQAYAESLGLNAQQLDQLKQKTNDFALTWGDVWNGLKQTAEDALTDSSGWQAFRKGSDSAFGAALQDAVNFAAFMEGHVSAAYETIVEEWSHLPQAFGDAFLSAVNKAIDALNLLLRKGADGLNRFIQSIAPMLATVGIKAGSVSAPQIGGVANPYAGAAQNIPNQFLANATKNTAAARAQIEKNLGTVYQKILGAAETRIGNEAPNAPKGKKPKQPKRNPADDELNKLDAQIASENALTQAYLTSDAAVIKAEADQKAMVLAVEKHADAAQTAALKEKEFALAIATISEAGAKEIANLNADAAARQKVNALVAAGLIPASQANQAIQDELQMRQQLAALTAAQEDLDAARHVNDQKRIADDIAAIQRLQGVIAQMPVSQAADEAAKAQTDAAAQIAANDNQIAQMKLKNQLIGQSNEEIAVQLALLQEQQNLVGSKATPAQQATLLAQAAQKAQLSVQTPFQQWAATVPQTAQAVNDALQQIEFKGFDALGQSIADVVTGTKSLGAAFHDIANQIISDIIQMTVKMLIFKALTGLGLFGSGGGGGSDLFGGAIFGGGGLTGTVPGLASGGPVSAGSLYLVGEKGPELFRPSSSGTIIPNAANNNAGGPIEVNVNLVVEPSEDLTVKSAQVASQVVDAKTPGIVNLSVQTSSKLFTRKTLNG